MTRIRQFLALCLLSLVVTCSCEDITTAKRRRGRPKKNTVKDHAQETRAIAQASTTLKASANAEDSTTAKASTALRSYTETTKLPPTTNNIVASVPTVAVTTSPTPDEYETWFDAYVYSDDLTTNNNAAVTVSTVSRTTTPTPDEYETWFDASGWWNEPNKTRTVPGQTTKKRRKFPTTIFTTRTTRFRPLKNYKLSNVTGPLQHAYYSLKQYYMKPENIKKADNLVREIIRKDDERRGIPEQYTWVSIETQEEGELQNEQLRNEMKAYGMGEISDI